MLGTCPGPGGSLLHSPRCGCEHRCVSRQQGRQREKGAGAHSCRGTLLQVARPQEPSGRCPQCPSELTRFCWAEAVPGFLRAQGHEGRCRRPHARAGTGGGSGSARPLAIALEPRREGELLARLRAAREGGREGQGKAPTSRSRRRRRCASSGTCWWLGAARALRPRGQRGWDSGSRAGTARAVPGGGPQHAPVSRPSAAAHAHTNTPQKKVISSSFRGHRLFATSRCKYRISPSGRTTAGSGAEPRSPCRPQTPCPAAAPGTKARSRGSLLAAWGSASPSLPPKRQRCGYSTRLAPHRGTSTHASSAPRGTPAEGIKPQ